jgi:hypothetical protein
MIVTIHQPEHMVWLGFIHKVLKADTFVILDTVQFRKNYFQNRNKIRSKNDFDWLTVPLSKASSKTLIKDIKISYDHGWEKTYLRKIYENYRKAPFFKNYYNTIEDIVHKKFESLVDLNLEILKNCFMWFNVKTEMVLASSLNLENVIGGTEVNLQICKALDASVYLSGPSGKDYLDVNRFQEANIKIVFHEFSHPVYNQMYEPFLPYMSAIDLLFNYGDKAINILYQKEY